MQDFHTIWTRNTKAFSVTLAWAYEDDGDLSWDETGEVLAKLESGEWTNHTFRVQVIDKAAGETIGEDFLGNSIYTDASEFIDHRGCGRQNREYAAKGLAGRCGSSFSDMVRNACAEARKAYSQPRAVLRAA